VTSNSHLEVGPSLLSENVSSPDRFTPVPRHPTGASSVLCAASGHSPGRQTSRRLPLKKRRQKSPRGSRRQLTAALFWVGAAVRRPAPVCGLHRDTPEKRTEGTAGEAVVWESPPASQLPPGLPAGACVRPSAPGRRPRRLPPAQAAGACVKPRLPSPRAERRGRPFFEAASRPAASRLNNLRRVTDRAR